MKPLDYFFKIMYTFPSVKEDPKMNGFLALSHYQPKWKRRSVEMNSIARCNVCILQEQSVDAQNFLGLLRSIKVDATC
jgi:hypothetical protein